MISGRRGKRRPCLADGDRSTRLARPAAGRWSQALVTPRADDDASAADARAWPATFEAAAGTAQKGTPRTRQTASSDNNIEQSRWSFDEEAENGAVSQRSHSPKQQERTAVLYK